MALDEQLRQALTGLGDRLRDELAREIARATDELAAVARADRDRAVEEAMAVGRADRDRAVDEAMSAARAERDRAVEDAVSIARAEHDRAIEEAVSRARADHSRAVAEAVSAVHAERDRAAEETASAARLERERAVEAAKSTALTEQERAVSEAIAAAQAARDRALEDAAASARAERQRAVDGALATAAAERDRAIAEAVAAARAEQNRIVEEAVAAARADLERARLEAVAVRAAEVDHGGDRLAEAIRAIDRAQSLGAILDALVEGASHVASRVALMTVEGPSLRGWRLAGFEGSFRSADEVLWPIDRNHPAPDTIVSRALRTGELVASAGSEAESVPAGFELPDGRQRTAVPILLSGQAVAVLYADEGAAGRKESARRSLSLEAFIDILARHASRSLEAVTAFKTARWITEGSEGAAPIPSSGPPAPASPASQSDDEASAVRFARLLVSEIKLYHGAEVAAGLRHGDLSSRLGGEIERARAMYEQRVSPAVRMRTDFFQAELVRTLAGGDARLLEAKS